MNLLIVAAALLQPAGPTAAPEPSPMPNGLRVSPACRTVPQQIMDRRERPTGDGARRLDREPRGELLLAVDRQVNGCRVPTFVSEERRDLRR